MDVMSKDNKNKKLEKTTFTQQEIWDAMRGNVHKSKKNYKRKPKHKGDDDYNWHPDRQI
jgi:hypothetical protein